MFTDRMRDKPLKKSYLFVISIPSQRGTNGHRLLVHIQQGDLDG
ncbi:hypothetical protein [Xylella fastidiosa]|nr:hypothetical protein [Xylella fastidiosa]